MTYSLRREVIYTVWGKLNAPNARWKLLTSSSDFSQASSLAKAFSGTALVIATEENRIITFAGRWDNGKPFRYIPFKKDKKVLNDFSSEKERSLFLSQLGSFRRRGMVVLDLWTQRQGKPVRYGWVIRYPDDEPSIEELNKAIHPGRWLSENFGAFLAGVSPRHKMSQQEAETFVRGRVMEGFATMASRWAEMGIPYVHGMCVYLLGYLSPWSKEVRETDHGWVDPFKWATHNFDRFKEHLPVIDNTDPNVLSIL